VISDANSSSLRPVYTTAQFASEVFGGARKPRWVADQCRARRIKTIKTVPGAPFLIPQFEAARILSGK